MMSAIVWMSSTKPFRRLNTPMCMYMWKLICFVSMWWLVDQKSLYNVYNHCLHVGDFFFDFFFGATKIHKTCDTHTYIAPTLTKMRWAFCQNQIKMCKKSDSLKLDPKNDETWFESSKDEFVLNLFSTIYNGKERKKTKDSIYFYVPAAYFYQNKNIT